MSQSPFFNEISPGPIGPRPDENASPTWLKYAWVVGIAVIVPMIFMTLFTRPDSNIDSDSVETTTESKPKTTTGNLIVANPPSTKTESIEAVSNKSLNQARQAESLVMTPEAVAIDKNAPEAGPWLEAHYRGLGHMERYEYDQAVAAFREVLALQPDWPGSKINLAIARLNQTGTEAEASKNTRVDGAQKSNFDEALELLDAVIAKQPGHLHAHYSRGIILEYVGRLADAHKDFRIVAVKDPADGYAWYKVGSTLTAEDPNQPAGPDQAAELVSIFERALTCNPYLVPALYRLQMAYAMAGDRKSQRATIERWTKLNSKANAAAYGDTAETFYGEMGKYARILNPPDAIQRFKASGKGAKVKPQNPVFSELKSLDVKLPEGCRWATITDLNTPDFKSLQLIRLRFGQSVAAVDINQDGKLDFYATSAVMAPTGLRDALLINLGQGRFEDQSSAYGVPTDHPSTGVAVADFDADKQIDLLLTGLREHRLLRNTGGWLDDVSYLMGASQVPTLGLTARWLDMDQDGDLDLYLVLHTHSDSSNIFANQNYPGQSNLIFRNDGVPPPVAGRPADNWAPLAVAPPDLPAQKGLSLAFTIWPNSEKLSGETNHHTGVAALDLDDDRDLDLILTQDHSPPSVAINDRQGQFTVVSLTNLGSIVDSQINGALVTDIDRDGRSDLVFPGQSGKISVLLNRVERIVGTTPAMKFEPVPIEPRIWLQVTTADLDLDGQMELIGLSRDQTIPIPDWGRYMDGKIVLERLPVATSQAVGAVASGMTVADIDGSPLPDLILWTETGPLFALNQTTDRPYIALDLGGRWKRSFDHMRTNPHALGARLSLEGQGLYVPYEHTTPTAGLAQSLQPVVLGTAGSKTIPLLRLRWPDGVMQCELNVPTDQRLALAENNRKTGSCPVLFTWNGEKFVCLGDFLGGGGLGYLVAPGIYSQPDRDEAMLIRSDQLRAENGSFRISITEPMDEVAYIDHLMLEVIDSPADLHIGLDERFSPGTNRPTGALRAWKKRIDPDHCNDLKGRDITQILKKFDRLTSDGFNRRIGWTGYAEDHGIELHFGEQLKSIKSTDRVILGLAGWVEYPYSQTNFAAASSGLVLKPPVLEIEERDGSWKVLEADPGYPAGLPRLTTLELTGKLPLDRPLNLRLKTNMECYYDEAFLAILEPKPELQMQVHKIPVTRAQLGWRGYTREISPDGKLPLVYDYDYIDPAPLAPMAGKLTRYGDVLNLLTADDDQQCVVGPGDEIRMEFDARKIPDLKNGWTRSFVLRSYGYCKDADPYTATSDDIGPMPYRGMPDYPFSADRQRPIDPAYQRYLDTYQTRKAGQ
ncbi:MAG: FG-GAP-like repeat-containing protein [Planctomycetota bacterium]